MPDSIADLLPALVDFRRDLHAHPELGFKEHRTAARIAAALREAGLEVHEGIGGTGIVGVLKAGSSDRAIALRADMDALPIQEQTGLPHASCHAGVFHGCGHDGHSTMLLGAARHLARTRRFDGTIHFIFQPAEEGLGGARAMVQDGLFQRFPSQRVFALHNWPDLPAGTVATRPGPIMAAADKFEITLTGKGGHAAMPHVTPDAVLAASDLVGQLNSIISRRIPPTSSAVLSVTRIQGGHAHNVLPAAVTLGGTVRSFDPAVQDTIEAALRQIVAGVALASGTEAAITYDRYYPATINDEDAAEEALRIAASVCTAVRAPEPAFTSEDFAFMLQACKGAYLWLGQGGASAPLHHPSYDFNDAIIPTGISLLCALAQSRS
ncbi:MULTISPECIES: M20 aminoacylase family protein [unclassified Azospirillum]|uniref:M20 aminoacylase family protein n=1 Tax=unclassified Azospirillum TaxID=2630922 RepID=UPI000B64ECAA|nr:MULTISPECIES: M20 aminoacylase family protein [unclassified Azospirillum]SNS71459.1 hippurate hydrolase [Azospirillum sp. RU38E]SNS89560.1 hippurate hydrolase [Azospirillum sp. RU37A]